MSSDPSQVTESNVTIRPTRLHYLDWLRVLAMFSIFFFHNARFFDFEDWHVKNAETSLGPDILIEFFSLSINVDGMPHRLCFDIRYGFWGKAWILLCHDRKDSSDAVNPIRVLFFFLMVELVVK